MTSGAVIETCGGRGARAGGGESTDFTSITGATSGAVNAAHVNGAHLAAARGHLDVIRALLLGGVGGGDADGLAMAARDLSKWSVLHHAAFHGQMHVLQALLQREVAVKGGEFVNLKDRWGRTALAYAVANAHLDAYRVLRVRLECSIRNPKP